MAAKAKKAKEEGSEKEGCLQRSEKFGIEHLSSAQAASKKIGRST
jgi:hypothetical protein